MCQRAYETTLNCADYAPIPHERGLLERASGGRCDDRRRHTQREHRNEAMTDTNEQIKLTIKGARAERGVSLSDFESFIENFLAAVRDYDRAGRGEPTRKSGHPDRRAEAVTAFRLVGFRTGSGVAILEPEAIVADDGQLPLDVVPLSLATLRDLVGDLAAERPVPEPVLDALGKACRAVGADGSVAIEGAGLSVTRVVVDGELLDRLTLTSEDIGAAEVRSVSGRLHLLDLEPDRLGIRTTSGVEWSCRYPEELEERVKALLDKIVWVTGSGKLASPARGAMTIEHIESVDVEQSALFTPTRVGEDELLARQRITAPQGLAALTDPQWDDETDDAYLAAMLSK